MTNPDATPPETRSLLRVGQRVTFHRRSDLLPLHAGEYEGHACTIADRGVGPSWWVRFDDGQAAPVHADELTPLSSDAPQAESPTADRTVQTETEEGA